MHFEFIFLRGVKGGMVSFFFYLHLSVQCSQHHLFKRLSLSHCINLSCLSSFWECVKKIFFLFEKPTKSLIVIVSESLIKQPTDRYSSVPSLPKCRFLHNYQRTNNNIDRIWYSYLLIFPIPTSFYVGSIRAGAISYLNHSRGTELPICLVPTLLLTLLEVLFNHSSRPGAGLAKWLLEPLFWGNSRLEFWFGDRDSELGL